ncbi:hypothetical protein HPB47_003673 [Ixodes persulcatus]|uniref:Uncharacterized protein n=1 Tax=Ixodes persulcatus TaxID=34615 RepID=A0AC60PHR6_IXOPE|nr:hypothetical protein HPB47_003673 [Ixodes persulcatus]
MGKRGDGGKRKSRQREEETERSQSDEKRRMESPEVPPLHAVGVAKDHQDAPTCRLFASWESVRWLGSVVTLLTKHLAPSVQAPPAELGELTAAKAAEEQYLFSSSSAVVSHFLQCCKFLAARPAIDVTKQTLIFVWSLANLECFRSIGDRFGLSKSTVCRVVHRVGPAVLTHSPNFVSWPTEKKALHIISGFEAKAGFPGVLGAIDGSHIVCKGLQGKDAQSYINRHGLPSVLLQAICDHEARFLHCSAGDPGSVHDARMYRRSELPTILTADKFPFDSHLLGDGAYPLRQSLLVPYRNNGRLTSQVH